MPGILNILHIHINDESEEVGFEVITISQNEEIKEHMQFKKDAMGVTLRYRVVVQDMRVIRVIYNLGSSYEELKFKETSIKETELVSVLH